LIGGLSFYWIGSPASDLGKTKRLEITFSAKWPPHSRAEDGPAIRFEQHGEYFDNRCLARTVGAEQGENTAFFNLKIYAL
jgi:hypothetical protein